MWNPKEFVLPKLYAALQTDDEGQFEIASDNWDNSSENYQEYLASVDWPDWLREFIFGQPETRINSSDKLHDAEIKEFWHSDKKLIMVCSTKSCAWDGRKSVVVVEYELDSVPIILDGEMTDDLYYAYDQFSEMGEGVYRHYIMFDKASIQIDFTFLKVTRFVLSNESF